MSDPNFVTPGGAGAPQPPPPAEPPRPSRAKAVGILGALMVLALVASYFGLRRAPEPAPVVSAPVPDAGPAVAPAAEVSLPESDARVRELVGKLSVDPELAKWLQERDLVRRFTAAVGNIAEGESPRTVLAFMAPAGAFQATDSGQRTTIDARSYARYDLVARVFGSIDANGSALVFRELRPLIDQAYAEIAPPGQTFDKTFGRAIQHLLDVPVPQGPVELKAKGALFVYAAPELEGLSRAQKHLLRMGPENMRTMQAKLRELQGALNLPVAER